MKEFLSTRMGRFVKWDCVALLSFLTVMLMMIPMRGMAGGMEWAPKVQVSAMILICICLMGLFISGVLLLLRMPGTSWKMRLGTLLLAVLAALGTYYAGLVAFILTVMMLADALP